MTFLKLNVQLNICFGMCVLSQLEVLSRSDEGQVEVVNNKIEFQVWSLFYKLV